MNRAFGFIPTGTCIHSMGFKAKKSEQREQNMTSLYNLFAALASLDATTLLNATVIFLDIPTQILERFSVGFRGIQNISSPVFRFLVGVNNPENFDETLLSQVNNSSLWRDINIRNRAVVRMIWINQPVGFESGTPMPFQ